MNILGLIGNLLGIGKSALDNRAKLKQLKSEQEFKIIEATTTASVYRIMNNTESDNQIDLITAENKKYTYKDEIITYLFLMPVAIATLVPFIIALKTNDWVNLNSLTLESYQSLDKLPTWYKYALAAVIIDVLGFRSFARKLLDKYAEKVDIKKQLLNK
ncbi:MAG: hypothetical protein ACJA2M_000800 [Polaribacter sp.]|jgi:hypothetical protein